MLSYSTKRGLVVSLAQNSRSADREILFLTIALPNPSLRTHLFTPRPQGGCRLPPCFLSFSCPCPHVSSFPHLRCPPSICNEGNIRHPQSQPTNKHGSFEKKRKVLLRCRGVGSTARHTTSPDRLAPTTTSVKCWNKNPT